LGIQFFAFHQYRASNYDSVTQFIPLWYSFAFVCFIPFLSISVRRLHDVGNGLSGWWLLGALLLCSLFFFFFIALFAVKSLLWLFLIIALVLLVLFLEIAFRFYQSGSTQSNRFGPPANDLMPSNYQFVFTKNLKRCAIAFIILFIAIFIWDWVVVYEKVLPLTELMKLLGK
jgi:uncharacterized membrane protein YhaH (DUF805 family)